MNNKWKKIGICVFILALLAVMSCGLLGESGAIQTPQPPPQPDTSPKPDEGPCGDGVCDEVEQANPALCPQDCGPVEPSPTEPPAPQAAPTTETPLPQVVTPPTLQTVRASLKPMWRSSYGACPGRQVDDIYAEMEFTWTVADDGHITGSGEGTMYAESVSRCPDTDYVGLETEPYPVKVTGSVVDVGWKLNLAATDNSVANYTYVYHEECVLCWVMPQFEGIDLSGTLSSFTLPEDVQVGDQFTFEMDYHVPQPDGSYVNDHVGTAVLEILEITR